MYFSVQRQIKGLGMSRKTRRASIIVSALVYFDYFCPLRLLRLHCSMSVDGVVQLSQFFTYP
jgi:hypothetical protein